eukprot:scaffold2334_cov138-Skeletonema_menzelii.AAC.1
MYSDSYSFEGQSLYDSFYESSEEESWDDASSDEDDDNYNENESWLADLLRIKENDPAIKCLCGNN